MLIDLGKRAKKASRTMATLGTTEKNNERLNFITIFVEANKHLQ